MQKKLSVITVNRNNAEGLRRTVESVLSQTFRDLEFIIIDGASTDASLDVFKEYAQGITIWKSEPDKGTYDAMNKGIKASSGEYCYFLNSGDYLAGSTVLERVFNENLYCDIVSGDVRKLRPNGKYRTIISPESVSLHKLCIHSLPHQATLIRRSLFEEIGLYSENYRIVSDWEFFLKALVLHSKTYQHIDVAFSYFRLGGISSRKENIPLAQDESYDCLKKLFPLYADDLMEYRNFHNSNLGQVLSLLRKKKKLYRFIDNACGWLISGKKAIAGK